MDNLTDTPSIGCDEDWLELNDGEQGVLRGRLYGPLKNGHDSLIVSNTAWEVIAVAIPQGYAGGDVAAGTRVTVLATRCEDGLETETADIDIYEEDY